MRVSYDTLLSVNCVVGSPMLWALIMPTISPGAMSEFLYFSTIISSSTVNAFLLKRFTMSKSFGDR